MRGIRQTVCLIIFVISANAFGQRDVEIDYSASGNGGAVAAGRETAVAAGVEILQRGGNAVDAAAATILVQSVVTSRAFCFGGEVPWLVYDAKRDVVEVVCGQGVAPQLATLQWFQEHKDGKIPRGDPSSAAVPAVLHACVTALDRYGTMQFADVAEPMLRALDRDEPQWNGDLAVHVRTAIGSEAQADDRRRGLEAVIDYFYRGPAARALDAWCRKNGGLIRYEDLAGHQTRIEQPLALDWHGYTIYKCGPWTQGPVLLQTLTLLDGYDLQAMGHNSPDYVHTVVETMKLTLADRDAFYADPLFVDVPIEQLLSDSYTDMRRSLLNPKRASLEQQPGDPRRGKPLLGVAPDVYQIPDAENDDTTTCLVADRWGNVVAATVWPPVIQEKHHYLSSA